MEGDGLAVDERKNSRSRGWTASCSEVEDSIHALKSPTELCKIKKKDDVGLGLGTIQSRMEGYWEDGEKMVQTHRGGWARKTDSDTDLGEQLQWAADRAIRKSGRLPSEVYCDFMFASGAFKAFRHPCDGELDIDCKDLITGVEDEETFRRIYAIVFC
ncbi:hypothetical protein BDZ97DRAFT_2059933 [Flammula alnicola]|nr:hypothetical protein BDZ97DRAFT_2059933 [Flammula alnicola]